MKAIIQAYSPEEVERIARGEQTVKVCKTAPKDTPFKVYIYATKPKVRTHPARIYNSYIMPESGKCGSGKVVGEFVCERVDTFKIKASCATSLGDKMVLNEIAGKAGIRTQKLIDCFRSTKEGKALHVTAVRFYDEPKSLNSFKIACNKSIQCNSCEYRALVWHEDKKDFYYECGRPAITHAPHGWQYVEELNYGL